MLIVPIEEAKAGMKLAMTVTHPEQPGQDLLRRGFVLDAGVLGKLRELGVPFIYVDYPGLEDLDRHLAPHLSPERQALYAQIKTSLASCQRETTPAVDYWGYHDTTRDFITTLLDSGRNPIYLDQLSTGLGGSGVSHGLAVAHLALIMGIQLDAYLIRQRRRLKSTDAKDVVNLGIAGMLHDLGKTKLPAKLQSAHALTPPEHPTERADWEAHAVHGFEMLRESIKPTAAAAVLNHHQHFDGSGFPTQDPTGAAEFPQEAQEIHAFARILLAADLYERLAVADDGKGRRSNLEILHRMRQDFADWLDPEILLALPRVVPPFPPGTRVTLSDHREAIVTQVESEQPYSPVVRPLAKDGHTLEASIRLRKCPELSIREVAGVPVGDRLPPAMLEVMRNE